MRIIQFDRFDVTYFRGEPLGAHDTLMLRGMVRSDELGLYDSLGFLLRNHGLRLQKGELDDHASGVLSHLRERYLEANFIEASHGKGSLLSLDHPSVLTMISRNQIVTPDEVDAATKFRAVHERFYREWRALAITMSAES